GAAAPLASIPVGAQISAVDGSPVANWNEVLDRFADARSGSLALQFSDGQEVTLDLPANSTQRFEILGQIEPFAEPLIGEVTAGSPAEVAGRQEGDRVTQAAGRPVRSWAEFVEVMRAHP